MQRHGAVWDGRCARFWLSCRPVCSCDMFDFWCVELAIGDQFAFFASSLMTKPEDTCSWGHQYHIFFWQKLQFETSQRISVPLTRSMHWEWRYSVGRYEHLNYMIMNHFYALVPFTVRRPKFQCDSRLDGPHGSVQTWVKTYIFLFTWWSKLSPPKIWKKSGVIWRRFWECYVCEIWGSHVLLMKIKVLGTAVPYRLVNSYRRGLLRLWRWKHTSPTKRRVSFTNRQYPISEETYV